MFSRLLKGVFFCLGVPLLLLVLVLLAMDIPDRRPFLQGIAKKGIEVVDAGARWAKDVIESDESSAGGSGSSLSSDSSCRERPTLSSLPADFRWQLESDVRDLGQANYAELWDEVLEASGPRSQRIAVVELARRLPRRWWPLNGELVHELDLEMVLEGT